MIFVIGISLLLLVYGLYAMLKPVKIATENSEFIESGREDFFEQRRSWKAYNSTPPVNVNDVRRKGRRQIILGLIGLFLVSPFIYFLEQF